jgi:imidazolonepropionase-like amidohydrolase
LIYTGKEIVEDAFVVFQGSKIVGISKRPRGEVTVEAEVVTPALIDAHSHIGMHRAGEPGAEDEANEKFDSFTTSAEALDSVQMDDASFKLSLRAGVLYSCVLPGSGNIIGGRGAVIRNYGKTTNAALELITRRNAKILGVDDKLGTLEKGKWASFVCWSGDPFDLAHNPVEVFAEGRRLPLGE